METVQIWSREEEKYITVDRLKANNAYILFYERVQPQVDNLIVPVTPPPPSTQVVSVKGKEPELPVASTSTAPKSPSLYPSPIPSNNRRLSISPQANWKIEGGLIKCEVPPRIMKQIWVGNEKLIRLKTVYDEHFISFIWELVNLYQIELPKEKLDIFIEKRLFDPFLHSFKLLVYFTFETFTRARDNRTNIALWFNTIKRRIDESPRAAHWLLENFRKDRRFFKFVTLVCPFDKYRLSFIDIMLFSIKKINEKERPKYSTVSKPPAGTKIKSKKSHRCETSIAKLSNPAKITVIRFMDTVLRTFKSALKLTRCCNHLFLIPLLFAKLGDPEKQFLIVGRNFIQFASKFFVLDSQNQANQATSSQTGTSSTSTISPPTYTSQAVATASAYSSLYIQTISSKQMNYLIETISLLVCSLQLPPQFQSLL